MFIPVILAGGSGERFWPLSRRAKPKQFLNLDGTNRSLLQATVDRLLPLAPIDNILIVTGVAHRGLILEQLPELPLESLLVEPEARNTAPAVLLAALKARDRFGDQAIIGVFASDHRIVDSKKFEQRIQTALETLNVQDAIITLGIQPDHPSTGYGYIKAGRTVRAGVREVNKFVEKPDLQTAQTYLDSGEFFWNAGMFIFRIATILEEFQTHAPEFLSILEGHYQNRLDLASAFAALPKLSIDYAILEKSKRVLVVPADIGWDDMGDWNALERLLKTSESNIEIGQHVGLDSSGMLLYTTPSNDLIVTIGLEDVLIVRDGDCTLIAKKSRTQDIRQLVQRLKEHPELKKYT
jgi:mannose-1-phosphate guanylyltransferase